MNNALTTILLAVIAVSSGNLVGGATVILFNIWSIYLFFIIILTSYKLVRYRTKSDECVGSAIHARSKQSFKMFKTSFQMLVYIMMPFISYFLLQSFGASLLWLCILMASIANRLIINKLSEVSNER
jgi:hypothetical protein